jgi:hypothetical protein
MRVGNVTVSSKSESESESESMTATPFTTAGCCNLQIVDLKQGILITTAAKKILPYRIGGIAEQV